MFIVYLVGNVEVDNLSVCETV